jgi:HPt (histidine-containing phosphotransfer) domain-containing protein
MDIEGNLSEKEESLQNKLEFLNEDLGEETVVELSEVFIESTKEIINKLNNASTAGDYQTIRNLVHSLRGNSGTFGFELLVSTCKELEIKINESSLDGVDILLAKVISEVNENVFILKKMLNK